MRQAELIMLVFGVVVVVFSATVYTITRRRHRADQALPDVDPGLIAPTTHDQPPAGVEPGLAGALLNGRTDMRDVFVALADLAARGYLQITRLTAQGAGAPDWQMQRTQKADADLPEADRAVLAAIFTAPPVPGTDERTPRPSVRLGLLLADHSEPLSQARQALRAEGTRLGWFHRDPHDHHTTWGWVGGVLTIVGLVLAVISAIDVMATSKWSAMVGPLLVVAGGLLLASLGRLRAPRSALGNHLLDDLDAYRRHLDALRPEQVDPAGASALFKATLPWTLVFGSAEDFATTMSTMAQRSAGWGKPVRLDLAWFSVPATARPAGTRVGASTSRHDAPTPPADNPLVSFARAVQEFVDAGGKQDGRDDG